MSSYKLTSAGSGQKVQAGVDLEIPAAIAIDSTSSTPYTSSDNAIQTILSVNPLDTAFTGYLLVSTDSSHTNVNTVKQFIFDGRLVTVYLKASSGSTNIEVTTNLGNALRRT